MLQKLGKYMDLFHNKKEQANPYQNAVLFSIILYLIKNWTFVHKGSIAHFYLLLSTLPKLLI